MADFDLTQTDAQVQSILDDAQDAQGAGAQTTLTTDYIMLKGTNGRYHKILKDSFTEAVRNVLAGLLVNNDKGTTISQIPAIASGDFGSVTPSNLASVLGDGVTGVLANSSESVKIKITNHLIIYATNANVSFCEYIVNSSGIQKIADANSMLNLSMADNNTNVVISTNLVSDAVRYTVLSPKQTVQ